MQNGFLDQFPIPEEAAKQLATQNLNFQKLDDGVTKISGHDKGVGFRFFIEDVKNELKSEIGGYDHFDEIEMIEWYPDGFNTPNERVKYLPRKMLAVDRQGNIIGGEFFEAYKRFKEGKTAIGTPLDKWGVLSSGHVKTLATIGIHTVEQLSTQPRGKFEGVYPQEICDSVLKATQFVNAKEGKYESDKLVNEMADMKREASNKDDAIALLQEQVKSLMGLSKVKGKPGRKAKTETKEETENVD